MAIKELWSKTRGWLRSGKLSKQGNYEPLVNEQGLISQDSDSSQAEEETPTENQAVVVKPANPDEKGQSLEKLQAGFDKLIEQLQSINEHLNHQVSQHENLMNQLDKMPKLLESFPSVLENQKELTEQLFEQLKAATIKNEQFIDAVEKIPTETGKQTDALTNINHQLAAAADADVQMSESINKFNETLNKLDQSTVGQTDSILQMSKTFATSDRYLKYLMSRQNKRLMWLVVVTIGVCVFAIAVLTCIIIYLN